MVCCCAWLLPYVHRQFEFPRGCWDNSSIKMTCASWNEQLNAKGMHGQRIGGYLFCPSRYIPLGRNRGRGTIYPLSLQCDGEVQTSKKLPGPPVLSGAAYTRAKVSRFVASTPLLIFFQCARLYKEVLVNLVCPRSPWK